MEKPPAGILYVKVLIHNVNSPKILKKNAKSMLFQETKGCRKTVTK